MKRKDNWKPEEDRLLAETVIKHVSQASTQLKAFKEVAERLNRTESAVGFRWNSKVRKEYEKELEEAKKEAKKQKSGKAKQEDTIVQSDEDREFIAIPGLTDEEVELLLPLISYMKEQRKNNRLATDYHSLKAKYEKLEQEHNELKEDYHRYLRLIVEAQQKYQQKLA